MNDFWSRERFNKRVKEYQADIRHARLVARESSACIEGCNLRDLVKSMVQGLEFHRLAYKVKHLKGGNR